MKEITEFEELKRRNLAASEAAKVETERLSAEMEVDSAWVVGEDGCREALERIRRSLDLWDRDWGGIGIDRAEVVVLRARLKRVREMVERGLNG